VVIEMATGAPPWSEFEPVPALFQIGKEGALPNIPNFLSQMAVHFIKLCFTRIPSKRPTAEQLLGHEFLDIGSSPQLKESATFIFKAEQEQVNQSKPKQQRGFQQTVTGDNANIKTETHTSLNTLSSFPSLSSLSDEFSFEIQNAGFEISGLELDNEELESETRDSTVAKLLLKDSG